MANPEVVVLVRFQSALPLEEILKRSKERIDAFRALPGLEQKYYLHDPASGAIAGLYLWRAQTDVAAFQQSELRATIREVYEVQGDLRVEAYQVALTLRDEA